MRPTVQLNCMCGDCDNVTPPSMPSCCSCDDAIANLPSHGEEGGIFKAGCLSLVTVGGSFDAELTVDDFMFRDGDVNGCFFLYHDITIDCGGSTNNLHLALSCLNDVPMFKDCRDYVFSVQNTTTGDFVVVTFDLDHCDCNPVKFVGLFTWPAVCGLPAGTGRFTIEDC